MSPPGHDRRRRIATIHASAAPLDRALFQQRTAGEARRALLRARGFTLADIARGVRRHLSIVSRVNAAKKRSRPVERAIARYLGLQLRQAFPEWYGAGSTRPVRRRVRPGGGSAG